MDPREDTENLEATEIEDDDDLEDGDFEDEDDEAELSQAELDDRRGRDTERELDHGLKETFPASDPVSINPGAD